MNNRKELIYASFFISKLETKKDLDKELVRRISSGQKRGQFGAEPMLRTVECLNN
jgi:hypothetical protein